MADRLTAEAKSEADSMLADARNKSEQLLSDARAKSDGLVNDARSRAETMLNDARTRAETLERQSRDKAAQLVGDAERKQTEIIGSITRDKSDAGEEDRPAPDLRARVPDTAQDLPGVAAAVTWTGVRRRRPPTPSRREWRVRYGGVRPAGRRRQLTTPPIRVVRDYRPRHPTRRKTCCSWYSYSS